VVAPFHFDVAHTSFPMMGSLDHTWESGHAAWNKGLYDGWIDAKSGLTMGYLARSDMPYHFALADAFTVCDSYFSSVLGPTCPNRLYLFTGSADPAGKAGGPVTACTDITQVAGGKVFGREWRTYPERLQSAGVSWQVYRQGADPASDDDSDGGMNSLLSFEQFRNASPGDPLYERGVRPRRLSDLKKDVVSGRLAQVSWIVPPRLFCEHPKWPPAYGVEYIARILDALTANPDIWSRTVFLLMYDENDGFFDHVVPPVPPLSPNEGVSTVSVEGEMCSHDRRPFGLGARVPMIAISPWSRGGWVCSQVFDHTSVIRFIETRFGVREDNISPWRRAICGNLISAFDFDTPNERLPKRLELIDAARQLPDEASFDAYSASLSGEPKPTVPSSFLAPAVEAGSRKARPVAYDFLVRERLQVGRIELEVHSRGEAGAAFYVYDLKRSSAAPKRYTVHGGASVRDSWSLAHGEAYALRLLGPNGLVHELKGTTDSPRLEISVSPELPAGVLGVVIANSDWVDRNVTVWDAYAARHSHFIIAAGHNLRLSVSPASSGHWYDLTFSCGAYVRRVCGHLETGEASRSDPLMAAHA